MKKITLLFLVVIASLNLSAQYSTDGVYTFKNVGTTKYLTVNTSNEVDLRMQLITTPGDTAMFQIIKNEANSTESESKFNIISKDNYVLSYGSTAGVDLVDNTAANRNLSTALFSFPTSVYSFNSSTGVVASTPTVASGSSNFIVYSNSANAGTGLGHLNGQRDGDKNLGMGYTTSNKYWWTLERIGDLVASTDVTAPTAPTNFAADLGTKAISWTEGSDAVGVKKTYILRATNTAATAPVLTQQEAWVVNGTIGDWTVVGIVAGGTTTFTDATAATSTDYVYAIAHRDMAYNNSDALVSATVNYTSTGVENTSVSKFNVIGGINKIELNSLPAGNELSIFNLAGAKVYRQMIETSQLSVNMPKGVYIVRVANTVSKVVVR